MNHMKIHYFFNTIWVRSVVLALLINGLALLGTPVVSAVSNNISGLPSDPVLSQMASWGQTTNPNSSSGRTCGGFNNAQWGWVSTGNTAQRSVTLALDPDGQVQNSLNLKYNLVGAYCDSIINSNGVITNTTLQSTTSTITQANIPNNTNLSLSGLGGRLVTSYALAAFSNSRYTYIESDDFSISGFRSLQPGTYTIRVYLKWRPVNNFNPGGYRCVVNNQQSAANDNDTRCLETDGTFDIRVVVPSTPQDSSWCAIDVQGTVQPGQAFVARFTLKNGGDIPGASVWPTTYFKLGSTDPRDNTRFTRTRVTPNGSRNTAVGPVIDPGQTTITEASFTAPATQGTYNFSWGLLEEGQRWLDSAVKCSASITVGNGSTGDPPELVCEIISLEYTVRVNQVLPVLIRVTNRGASTIGYSAQPANLAPTSTTTGKAPNIVTYNNEFLKHPDPGSVAANAAALYPGESFNFAFEVKAPSTPKDEAIFLWALHTGSDKVLLQGNECLAKIKVEPPKNSPFLTVAGGDVISGASFGPACTVSDRARNAAINTNGFYTKGNVLGQLAGTSSSQYAVFASGEIGENTQNRATNTFLGNYGYYDRAGLSGVKEGLFANISYNDPGGTEYGNFYEQNPSDAGIPCVKFDDSAAAASFDIASFVGSGTGTQKINGNQTLGSVSNITGKKTLIVNGTLTIAGSLTYANTGSYANVSAVPKLTIIANNIHVQVAARTLDGHYIAFPRGATDGIFDTCSDMDWYNSSGVFIGKLPGEWPANGRMVVTSCKRDNPSFTVNGSVIAKRILWKRTNGTIGSKSEVIDSSCFYANYAPGESGDTVGIVISDIDTGVQRKKRCSAELIEFSPESLIGNFSNGFNIESVPTSSVELPPVY